MALRNAFGNLNLEITQQAILNELQTQQKNALTNGELRASPLVVNTGLNQPTTPADTQPVNVQNQISGFATEVKQLPDNHNVTVSNFPASQVVEVSAPLPVEQDSGEQEFIHVPFTATNAGDTIVYTPAIGKRIRLRWIYAINDPTASTAPVISVKLGTQEIYRVYALSKRQKVTGPINGQLIINLSVPGNVQVTALIEEI